MSTSNDDRSAERIALLRAEGKPQDRLRVGQSVSKQPHRMSRPSTGVCSVSQYVLAEAEADSETSSLKGLPGGTSTLATTFSLTCVMVGTGVLGLPYQFRAVGCFAACLICVLGASASAYACILISKAIDAAQEDGIEVVKLGDMAKHYLGSVGAIISDSLVIFFLVGKTAIFMLLLSKSSNFLSGNDIPFQVWVLFWVVIFLAMAFLKNMTIVNKVASVGVLCAVLYCVAMISGGIMAISDYGEYATVNIWPDCSIAQVGACCAVMVFGFGPMDVLTSLKKEMKDPKAFPSAVIWSHFITAVTYILAGFVSYVGWGDLVQSPVTQSMCSFPGCAGSALPAHPAFDPYRTASNIISEADAGQKYWSGYLLSGAIVVSLAVTVPITAYVLMKYLGAQFQVLRESKVLDSIIRILYIVTCGVVVMFVPLFNPILSVIASVITGTLFLGVPCIIDVLVNKSRGDKTSIFVYGTMIYALFVLSFGTYEAMKELITALQAQQEDPIEVLRKFFFP